MKNYIYLAEPFYLEFNPKDFEGGSMTIERRALEIKQDEHGTKGKLFYVSKHKLIDNAELCCIMGVFKAD